MTTQEYPLPENEEERHEKLRQHDILDTPEDPSFDRLTEMASSYFDVPIALVSLIDEDRQWFKSHVGTDFRQTERSCAFCNYVLVNENVLVIEDALQDPRVEGNRLVVDDPEIRFYAGAPLTTENDHILGTFCILDTEPREMTDDQLDILELFADEAFSQIELRHRNKRIEEKNTELERVRDKLETSLEARNTLMEELVHRTKNNFNLITSLFRLQEREVDSKEAREVLQEARSRVRAMGVLHERLNQAEKMDRLILSDYVREVTSDLLQSTEHPNREIDVSFELDDVEVPSDVAVYVGIILNELVTNAFEHAFDEDDGTLTIELRRVNSRLRLLVEDSGGSLPDDFSLDQTSSLGLSLVKTLAAEQLDGDLSVKSNGTTRFTIDIPEETL